MKDGWIVIGRVFRPRGNRGELLGEIDSSQPGRAEKLKDVVLEVGGRELAVQVEEVWYHGGRPVFKFVGIDSINQAEEWAGAEILVPESERAVPEEGEYSHGDLVGCRLVGEGPAEAVLGVVSGVEDYGGPPLLRVEATDGREILVPFARSICKEIDVASKIIRVELPEGLLDSQ